MLDYLLSAAVFLLIFTTIIVIHELGHYWAARFTGIGVKEFGLGLPPRAWGWVDKKRKMIWSLNWIPLGGFVRMMGEDTSKQDELKRKDAFDNRPLWGRILTVCAGVLMNMLLAFVILWIGFMAGMKPLSPLLSEARFDTAIERGWATQNMVNTAEHRTEIQIVGVVPESPADVAGLQPGDYITYLDNQAVTTVDDFFAIKEAGLRGRAWHLNTVMVDEDGVVTGGLTKRITPTDEGLLGIQIASTYTFENLYLGPVEAAAVAGGEMWHITTATVAKLGEVVVGIFTRGELDDEIGGPVRIASATHSIVHEVGTLVAVLQFTAILSLSIAVLNIMPIPALDGGRLLFLVAEGVTGQKPRKSVEIWIHAIGFGLLMLFILAVTIQDIGLLFS